MSGFAEGAAGLQSFLDRQHVPASARYNVELAFEEIATNIVRHAQATSAVDVSVALENDEVVLTFEDNGIAFDPLERPPVELPSSIEDAQVGGLGVMLVKKLAARVEYYRTREQRNHLVVAISTH